jgi:hypothetical protein
MARDFTKKSFSFEDDGSGLVARYQLKVLLTLNDLENEL